MKKIMVTTSWDDGHILDLKLADLLRKYSLKGTFYVSPKNREFPPLQLLTNEEIVSISQDFEIGAHTMTHPILYSNNKIGVYRLLKSWILRHRKKEWKLVPPITSDEVEIEIRQSREYLEKLLDKKITSFCYPDGRYSQETIDLVKKYEFTYARTVERFCSLHADEFSVGTTLHAFKHYQDIFKIAQFSKNNIIKLVHYLDWENLAIALFDDIRERGGIYHIWGHSWEIEQNNDWKRLERVFDYISRREQVDYVTNSETLPLLQFITANNRN